jgi:hypothetical protein
MERVCEAFPEKLRALGAQIEEVSPRPAVAEAQA